MGLRLFQFNINREGWTYFDHENKGVVENNIGGIHRPEVNNLPLKKKILLHCINILGTTSFTVIL